MSGNTQNQGYPYPLTSDFADVQDVFRLATAVDSDLRAAQDPFRRFIGAPSFIVRQTVAGSSFLSGTDNMSFGAIDWDNTGGIMGSATWVQPYAQAPSWWLFGSTMFLGGTPTAGDLSMSRIYAATVDPVTGVSTTVTYPQRNDDSNTSGEWINNFAMIPIYKAGVSLGLTLNGSTSRNIAAGTRLWGLYMGPVT